MKEGNEHLALLRTYIVGDGGLAREVAHILNQSPLDWNFAGYVTNDESRLGSELTFGSIVGTDDWLAELREPSNAILAVGRPHTRKKLANLLEHNLALQFPNIASPGTIFFDSAHVRTGKGNVFFPSLISCDVSIGDFNHFNYYSTVGHDCTVGSYNVINPSANLSGGSSLGDQILVGAGAQVLEGVSIENGATVGAGAVVISDVEVGQTVVGVPARPVRQKSK